MIQTHRCCRLFLPILAALASATSAFQALPVSPSKAHHAAATATALNLIPLKKFGDELGFFSNSEDYRCCIDRDGTFTGSSADGEEPFQICLVEENDLPDTSLFIIKAFGADAISLSSNEFNAFEKRLMEPALDFFNGYASMTAYAEVLWGLRSRNSDRVLNNNINDISGPKLEGLDSVNEKIEACNRKSLILVVARPNSDDSNVDVIASVELRLQPCDAKIPFSLPWWDALERKIASFFGIPKDKSAKHLQPYLSTLCVDETYRGQRIGKAMVRCLEDIALTKWGYSKMYLHVDAENTAALNLYKSEGYKDVGRRWNPFWAGRAADIGYFVKDLK